jgi:hypothetical protein
MHFIGLVSGSPTSPCSTPQERFFRRRTSS